MRKPRSCWQGLWLTWRPLAAFGGAEVLLKGKAGSKRSSPELLSRMYKCVARKISTARVQVPEMRDDSWDRIEAMFPSHHVSPLLRADVAQPRLQQDEVLSGSPPNCSQADAERCPEPQEKRQGALNHCSLCRDLSRRFCVCVGSD